MSQKDKKLIKSYAAKLLSSQVEFFKTQLEGMQIENNIDFLHHTRVMSRRMRSTIEVFQPYFGKKKSERWYSAIRMLTNSLTRIRDLDVQIFFLEKKLSEIDQNNLQQGVARLLLRKKQKRQVKQENVVTIIDIFNKTDTLDEITEFINTHPYEQDIFYPPSKLVELAKTKIEEQLVNCFSHVPFISNPENKTELHGLRISIKNLRYTTELFEPIYPDLKEFLFVLKIFQDDLGKIHDDDVWIEDLDNFMLKEKERIQKFYGHSGPINLISPGINYLKNLIVNERISAYETFLEHWNKYFQEQFWSRLRDQIIEFPEIENLTFMEDNPEVESSKDTETEIEDSTDKSI